MISAVASDGIPSPDGAVAPEDDVVRRSWDELRSHPVYEVVPAQNPKLPLADLPPEAFERLCAELVDRESKHEDVHIYGRRGQAQFGIDIVKFRTGLHGSRPTPAHVYQVKRFQEITPADLRAAVELYAKSHRFRADKFTVMTSAPTEDAPLLDELEKLREEFGDRFEVKLDGPTTIQHRLRDQPTTVRAVFGKAMAEALCGKPGEAPPSLLHLIQFPEAHVRTLRTAVEQAFRDDDEVRFNEAELVGPSVDAMFVDVPVVAHARTLAGQLLTDLDLGGIQLDWNGRQEFAASLAPPLNAAVPSPGTVGGIGPISVKVGRTSYEPMASAGGAQSLLHPGWLESTVIVGGPGQGKSTLLQYVCQAQRARHLSISDYEPEGHEIRVTAAIPRIPFRIDLRLYAKTRREILLEAAGQGRKAGKSRRPKKKSPTQDINDPEWLRGLPAGVLRKTFLETYISNQVSLASGGAEFTVDHLVNIVSRWPVLFAFDGLDEVAPLVDRAAVSDLIREFRNRYSSDALDAIVVVTTRPGVVERPIWNDPNFATLQLGDLVPALKMRYVEKWAQSVNLSTEKQMQLLAAFEAEHDKPHVREVSSNPMQLAILCRLLERRTVIPDQRTALYDEYISVFFDREFEKSDTIGQYRPTLAKIHAYLGWWMHTKAEGGDSNGTIDVETLRALLHDFLGGIGQPTGMIDELYSEMQARVICLVQRRQGSGVFEFEVQGIREYFAAQYLIKELSTTTSGTKGARLGEAIRRPYWWNAMRFAAGMFDDGELPDIVYVCRELQRKEFNRLPLPRSAAKQLLDDHIFRTVHLTVTEDLIRDALAGTGVYLAVDGLIQPGGAPFAFSDAGPAQALIEVLKERILASSGGERFAAAALLCWQLDRDDVDGARAAAWEWWWGDGQPQQLADSAPAEWLEVASALRLLSDLEPDEEERLYGLIKQVGPNNVDVLDVLARGGRWSPGPKLHELCIREIANGALDGYLPPAPSAAQDDMADEQEAGVNEGQGEDPEDEIDAQGRLLVSGPLGQLIRASQVDRCVAASKFLAAPSDPQSRQAANPAGLRRRFRGNGKEVRATVAALDGAFAKLRSRQHPEGWAEFLDSLEEVWGDSWQLRQVVLATLRASTQAAATRATPSSRPAEARLWPELAAWAENAELSRNSVEWWQTALADGAVGEPDNAGPEIMFRLAAAVALLNSHTMSYLAEELNSLCEALNDQQWGRVAAGCARAAAEHDRPLRLSQQLRTTFKPSPRLVVLLLTRADDAMASETARLILPNLSSLWRASPTTDSLMRRLLASAPRKLELDHLRGGRGALPSGWIFNLPIVQNLTAQACTRILNEPGHWPTDVVRAATESAEGRIAAKLTSMGDLAAAKNWSVPGSTSANS